MEFTVKEICKLVGGKLVGNDDLIINQISPIEEANEGSLSFLYVTKYYHYLYTTKASAVLVNKDFKPENNNHPALIYVSDVKSMYSLLLEQFANVSKYKIGIDEQVYLAKNVQMGKDVYLGAFAYIGDGVIIGNNVKIYPQAYIGDKVSIGDNTIVYSGAKIYNDCDIGKDCILHSGCVIGSDGFGFAPQEDGSYLKTTQIGNVVLKDNVEIGANTTIDKATMESTVLQKGVKLDNLIMIAHNVEIGENTVIAALTGVSGSTKLGERCIIAGQVGIVGHVKIADGSQIGAKSGVAKSIDEPDKKWFGVPLLPVNETLRLHIILRKLPELYRKILNK